MQTPPMPALSQHDVVVVGGRVAGALAAARLADRGMSVLVLEARSFPSATLSTHFFRGDGLVRSLAELDLLDEVLATGPPPLTCEYFYAGGDNTPERNPAQEPGEAGYNLSVRRETLDATSPSGWPTAPVSTSARVCASRICCTTGTAPSPGSATPQERSIGRP